MNRQDEHDEDRRLEQAKQSNFVARFLRGLGIVMGVLAVVAILLVGLVLGACFLRVR